VLGKSVRWYEGCWGMYDGMTVWGMYDGMTVCIRDGHLPTRGDFFVFVFFVYAITFV
jgi:hypothetical protein